MLGGEGGANLRGCALKCFERDTDAAVKSGSSLYGSHKMLGGEGSTILRTCALKYLERDMDAAVKSGSSQHSTIKCWEVKAVQFFGLVL